MGHYHSFSNCHEFVLCPHDISFKQRCIIKLLNSNKQRKRKINPNVIKQSLYQLPKRNAAWSIVSVTFPIVIFVSSDITLKCCLFRWSELFFYQDLLFFAFNFILFCFVFTVLYFLLQCWYFWLQDVCQFLLLLGVQLERF